MEQYSKQTAPTQNVGRNNILDTLQYMQRAIDRADTTQHYAALVNSYNKDKEKHLKTI